MGPRMTIGKQVGPEIGNRGVMAPKKEKIVENPISGPICFPILAFWDLFRDLFGFLIWLVLGPKPIFQQAVWIANQLDGCRQGADLRGPPVINSKVRSQPKSHKILRRPQDRRYSRRTQRFGDQDDRTTRSLVGTR